MQQKAFRFLPILFYLFIILILDVFSTYGREIGKPFIRNYSSKSYNAHTQNWAVVQDKRGVMYFGNTYGVLQYDGVAWRLIRVSNKSTVRSLSLGRDGKVYVGAVGELGYLTPNDDLGELVYHSLTDKLKPEHQDFGDVWSILVRDDEIFFHTRRYIFQYKNGNFKAWDLEDSYHRAFLIQGHIYLRQQGKGLFELRGENFVLLPNTQLFASEYVSALLPWENSKLLIGSRKSGLFIYDKVSGKLAPIFPDMSQRLGKANIYSGLVLENNNLAFSTLSEGVFIINDKGHLIQKLDVHSGIQNDRVYSTFLDRDGAMWLATDNGISHAEISMPLTDWDQAFGLKGTVYSILRHKDLLYAGTSNGVFALIEDEDGGFKFSKAENINTQSWHLMTYKAPNGKELLLAATSTGVYEIKQLGGRFIGQQIALPRVTTFYLLAYPKAPNKIYVGLLNGLSELTYNNGAWESSARLKGTAGAIRNMLVDYDGNIWLGTRYTGVIKIEVNEQFEFEKTTHYNTKDGLPNDHLVNVCLMDSSLIVVGPKGVVSYNKSKKRFESDPVLGEKYTTGTIGVLHAIEDLHGNRWIHAVNEAESIEWLEVKLKKPNGSYDVDSVTLKRLSGVEMYAIYPEENNITWIGGSDGLVRYDNKVHIDADNPFHTLIRGVHTHEDDTIFMGEYPLAYNPSHGLIEGLLQVAPTLKVLEYNQNSVSFHFAAATFENETDNRYSHYLENYDPPGYWSHWKHETVNEYTNLPEGDYKFYVKARNIYDHESSIACFEFTIKPPWYRTIQAYFLYVVAFLLLIWGIVALNIRRLKKKNRVLELKVWEKTKQLQLQNQEIEEKNVELAQQKEEIAAQRDHLMESFENIKVLSKIGKELTATLSIDGLIDNTYGQLVQLFDMSVFGLGFYRPESNTLEFPRAMVFGEKAPSSSYKLSDHQELIVHCFNSNKELLVRNQADYQKLVSAGFIHRSLANKEINSLIYLPLSIGERCVGIITIQHQHNNAYQEYHVNLLRNLATYIAIALENAEAYSQIQDKNEQIQRASQEITDSINYAKRIQGAMMPRLEDIQQEFPESFVFLKPKDIVSGDFYWYSSKRDIMGNNKHIIAAVDCTGHGVPGAFMSTIGIDLMDEIVNLMGISEADQILNYLHKLVRKSLRQKETKNHDGMDMAVCVIDRHRGKIEYAGAKNPLIMFRNGEKIEVDADRRSIGGSYWSEEQDERRYTKHVIHIDPEETLTCYLYTDGFQDQFGGPKRRKFMSRRFKDTLEHIHQKPMKEQSEILEKTLITWMEEEPQVDDVLVIGFRV